MLPAALHLASVASLWAALQGTVGVSASSRAGARSAQFGETSTGYDVDLGTGIGVSLTEARFNLSLGYGPNLTLRDVAGDQRTSQVMHGAYLSSGYAGRGYSLTLSESLSFGTTSFRGLRTAPLDPMAMPNPMTSRVELVPGVETVKVFNESTRGTFNYKWDPRVDSTLGAGYSITGGSGSNTQVVYPQIRTASAETSTGYNMSGYDSTGLSLSFSRTTTHGGTTQAGPTAPAMRSPDYLYYSAGLSLSWAHRFSTVTTSSLSVGAAGYNTRQPGFTDYYSLALTGGGNIDALLVRGPGYTLTGGLGGSVGPQVNQLGGQMQRRASGTGRTNLALGDFSINANGDVAQTIPTSDPAAIRLISVRVGASWAPARLVDVNAEYRNTWQTVNGASIPRLWVCVTATGR